MTVDMGGMRRHEGSFRARVRRALDLIDWWVAAKMLAVLVIGLLALYYVIIWLISWWLRAR